MVTGIGFDDSNPSNLYAAFITVPGRVWAPLRIEGEKSFTFTTIPTDVAGQSYVVITKGQSQVTDSNIANGPEFKCPFHRGCYTWLLRSYIGTIYPGMRA